MYVGRRVETCLRLAFTRSPPSPPGPPGEISGCFHGESSWNNSVGGTSGEPAGRRRIQLALFPEELFRNPVAGVHADDSGRSRLTVAPTRRDALKIVLTRTPRGSRCRPIALSPAEAAHPQLAQSGLPPNWQGLIRVRKSAEMQLVICEKTHSSGDAGGVA